MPCYHPLPAWYSKQKNKTGKRSLVFKAEHGLPGQIKIGCGQCIGCRLEYSRHWAVRCMAESQLHDYNCFITLTYDHAKCPQDTGLVKRHLQLFLKRLRKKCGPFRYFACGEYGDQSNRPHYHAILFGLDFTDKILVSEKQGRKLYTSPTLESVWGKGYVTIGEVTFESCAYVARYVVKKVTGKNKKRLDKKGLKPYERVDSITGEIIPVQEEFTQMSRGQRTGKGGIAKEWYDKYKTDCYPSGYLISRGFKVPIPRYFNKMYDIDNPKMMAQIKQKKLDFYASKNYTNKRLAEMELAKTTQLKEAKRTL